ncbi:MAG: nucleotidyltransferase domain-containing protein [Oscillospiraceae bacterium]|nr:nucleotidyltransferase domain-containing protein [Oscillospiraceae bacterium]
MCSQSTLNEITSKVAKTARDCFGEKLHKVILYGSYAREDYNNESDIDIMILADIARESCGHEYGKLNTFVSRLGLEHDIVISVDITDIVTFNKYVNDLPFYMNLQQEGVVLSA